MVGDLQYRIEKPQYIRMTLEDRSMCLKNFTDPLLTASACYDPLTEVEIEELRDTQSNATEVQDQHGMDAEVQKWTFEEVIRNIADTIYYSTCSGSGKVQSPKIEQWLSENFTEEEEGSVAREEMYRYYCESCKAQRETPCNQATFGKIIRVVFPNVRTRRLGVRGHSRYHYFGITPVNIKLSQSCQQRCHIKPEPESRQNLPQVEKRIRPEGYDVIVPYLSKFPTIQTFSVHLRHRNLAAEFLELYKDHAVTVIQAVLHADFDKVTDLMSDFWLNLPARVFPLVNQLEFLTILEDCDLSLYFVIHDILVPKVPDLINKRLSEAILCLLHSISLCLSNSLVLMPDFVVKKKIAVFRQFERCMISELQINYMYTLTTVVVHHPSVSHRLQQTWDKIDQPQLYQRISPLVPEIDKNKLYHYLNKVQLILGKLHHIPDHLLTLVDSVLQDYWLSNDRKKLELKQFILCWSYTGSQIIQMLAEHKSPLTGVFSLLEVLCKDYLLHKIRMKVDM